MERFESTLFSHLCDAITRCFQFFSAEPLALLCECFKFFYQSLCWGEGQMRQCCDAALKYLKEAPTFLSGAQSPSIAQ